MRLPTTANVRSLNLSNCVAIATYEVLRQQDYGDLLFATKQGKYKAIVNEIK